MIQQYIINQNRPKVKITPQDIDLRKDTLKPNFVKDEEAEAKRLLGKDKVSEEEVEMIRTIHRQVQQEQEQLDNPVIESSIPENAY